LSATTVLARKWRPKTFAQLAGQEHVVRALSNALAQNRLHHAYLFTGTRGVGKTTIARIFAKSLNCLTGITATPCGICSACTEIDSGRFIDLVELDAASNTGIDNMREVLDNAQYMPTSARFKVYIIDEVHMLSKQAFNSMLKTLEEPPGHVKFILATTDPQKIPVTVLSRCLQFNLKQLPPALIAEHLKYVLEQEQVAFDIAAIGLIARAAQGSMRDALSLLDQGIAFCGGKIEGDLIAAMLGSVDRGHVRRLLEALAQQDGAALLDVVDQLDEHAPDYGAVLDELAAALQRIAVLQLVPGRMVDDEFEAVVPFASRLSGEDVQLYYQIALYGRRDLPISRDPRTSFEMTLLRMLAFTPASDGESRPSRSAKTAPSRPAPKLEPSAAAGAAPGQGAANAASTPRSAATGGPSSAPDWVSVLRTIDLRGPARQLADHCDLVGTAGGAWQLVLPADKEHLNTQQLRVRLEAALREQYGDDLRLTIATGTPQRPTPAELRRTTESERAREARETIEADPNVRAMRAAFDATLEPDSIRSVK
jgi:DNA polymerase-3 subunit gamma/tau